MNKHAVIFLKKTEALSSIACRLTVLTGKSKYPLHPKHLIKRKLWYLPKLNKKDIVLDLGCGVGQDSIKVAKKVKKVIGIDINPLNIRIAKKTSVDQKIKNAEFIVFDVNKKLAFKSKSFDKIICSDVLEHLKRRNFAFKQLTHVLKPGGLIFFVIDNPDTSWKKTQKYAGLFYYADADHKYEYPKREIVKKLKENKLTLLTLNTVTYDTPLKGFIDLVGGISLDSYRKLQLWKSNMVEKFPDETTSYRIIAKK